MTTFFSPHRFQSSITYIYKFIAHVYYYSHTAAPKQLLHIPLNENIYAYLYLTHYPVLLLKFI